MRVAVLADIHGNLPALVAVLDEVDAAGVDVLVLNGDIATGPMPVETLDLLAELGDRAVWVRGNADREVVEAYDGVLDPNLPIEAREPTEYAASKLSRWHRDRLADLPLSATVEVDGFGRVRFCHATSRDDNEIVLVDSPIDQYREAFDNTHEPTVVIGHTHMPFDRLADRRRFINSGSVGMPFGDIGACWALLGPEVVLRRTHYDLDAAAATFRTAAADYPYLEEFIAANIQSTPSDADAIAAFSG
jgi:putative phosphoesterase